VINHDTLPSSGELGAKLMLKDIRNHRNRKPVGGCGKVNREEYYISSRGHEVLESPLRESSILRDSLQDPKKEVMKRAKSRLRPIVEDSDHSRLSFQIRDPNKPPYWSTSELKTPTIEPLKEGKLPHDPIHLPMKEISPNKTNLSPQSLWKRDEIAQSSE